MSDLIERSDVIKVVRHITFECIDADTRQKLIEAIPTVEPKEKVIAQVTFDDEKLREIVKEAVERFKEEYEIEPKRGEWIDYSCSSGCYCSNCDWDSDDKINKYIIKKFDFCPNCGADMREREGE